VNCGDEARIGRLVDTFDPRSGHRNVLLHKIGLTRWVRAPRRPGRQRGQPERRRPGGVNTTIMVGATG
jgi:hypothetical protein